MAVRMISKTKYICGLQCPKLLWVAINDKERLPEPDAATQHVFDQGHEVGELAKKLFPGGIDIQTEDFKGNIAMTKEFLRQRVPLFEAGLMAGPIYSRLDILNPINDDEWDIIEVKSSTSVKDVNLHDVSFQKLVCRENGLKIRNCFLAHINNKYVKDGEIVPQELFAVEDVTDEVEDISKGIADRVSGMLEVIGSEVCPQTDIGPHCSDPYDCALQGECWGGMPEHNVFTLYYGGKKSYQLYERGVLEIDEIPQGFNLNDKQSIQCASVVSGEPYINSNLIKHFLAGLEYPLYYLDFETFATAIPLFDGTRPYQNIPFQFSLHVQQSPGSQAEHFFFLAEGRHDPRPEFLETLCRVIGDSGTILAYNKAFEEGVLKSLAEAYTERKDCIDNSLARAKDLLSPFRSFHYYHPAQKGSASLKSVLPALTGKGYEDMAIADGTEANLAFLNITFDDTEPEEAARVREHLLAYCGLDTGGMVQIVEKLGEIVKSDDGGR